MEKIILPTTINVFGIQVKTFPDGISEVYDQLVNMIPGGFNRSYYGISYMQGNSMVYYATAEELNVGEAEKYSCERLSIEKGEYIAETVAHWRSNLCDIKVAFHLLIQDSRTDKTKPAIEWYKNEAEMQCMVKVIS